MFIGEGCRHMHAQLAIQRPEESVRSSRTRVTGICMSLNISTGNWNLVLRREHQVFLATEPSEPLNHLFNPTSLLFIGEGAAGFLSHRLQESRDMQKKGNFLARILVFSGGVCARNSVLESLSTQAEFLMCLPHKWISKLSPLITLVSSIISKVKNLKSHTFVKSYEVDIGYNLLMACRQYLSMSLYTVPYSAECSPHRLC